MSEGVALSVINLLLNIVLFSLLLYLFYRVSTTRAYCESKMAVLQNYINRVVSEINRVNQENYVVDWMQQRAINGITPAPAPTA